MTRVEQDEMKQHVLKGGIYLIKTGGTEKSEYRGNGEN